MASSTSGGTGVGPGASKYRFNMDGPLSTFQIVFRRQEGRYAITRPQGLSILRLPDLLRIDPESIS